MNSYSKKQERSMKCLYGSLVEEAITQHGKPEIINSDQESNLQAMSTLRSSPMYEGSGLLFMKLMLF